MIFTNAVLHWLPDHASLLSRLARFLAPGGTLAVQMPRQFLAPSHQLLRDIAATRFPDRFGGVPNTLPVAPAADYHQMLAPLGRVNAWETDYIQRLDAVAEGHPVRVFTASTAMRPYVEALDSGE